MISHPRQTPLHSQMHKKLMQWQGSVHRWQNYDWSGCRRHHAWRGGHLLLPRWYAVLWWRLWQCHCCQSLCRLGTVRETLACPNHPTPLPRIHGKVYEACVHSAMLHGSEMWAPNNHELQLLLHNDLLDLWHQRQRWNTLSFTNTEIRYWGYYAGTSLSATQILWPCTAGHFLYQMYYKLSYSQH